MHLGMSYSFKLRALFSVALLACAPLAGCAGADPTADDEDPAQGEEALEGEAEELTGFSAPTQAQKDDAMAAHSNLDPQGIVPRDLLASAVGFFEVNRSRINNDNFITVIDFGRHSGKKRFFLINMNSGAVESHVVAHGLGSDRGHTGMVQSFSNVSGSSATSNGFYLAAETYEGKHGRSLRLDGLSKSNSSARSRAVVIHGASYVNSGASKQGRSNGCPALDSDVKDSVISKIKGGSLIFAERAGSGGGSDLNQGGGGGSTCRSATLNRTVGSGVCVESRSDSNWYKCTGGVWKRTSLGCTESFPLN
jgi:L,D-transpeptidase catalytic domain